MQSYLDLAKMGRNAWWRYLLAVILILFTWQILGSLPDLALVILSTLKGGLSGSGAMQALASTPAGFAAIMLASVFFLGGIYLAMRFIHHRRMRTLITPAHAIAWGRFFQGFGLWFVLVALMAVVEALLYPGRYVWSLDLPRLVPFVLLALIFIPIQSGTEELFFRGYILQSLGLRVRNIWVLCAFSGLAFGLPHLLNPEASINYPLFFLYYFAFGFSLAYLTLRDGRLELALGAHLANNLFSVIFANYTITVLPSPSIFTVTVLDAIYSVPAGLLGILIFVWVFTGPFRRKTAAPD